MFTLEKAEKEKGYPVLAEIASTRLDFHPERHFVSATCVSPPRVDNSTPKWLDRIEEGKVFTGVTGENNFDGAEEKQYFLDLVKKYRRKTVVIWITDCRDLKKEGRYDDGNRVKGLFQFKAITSPECPTT